jgi:hypothetical protein
MSLKLKLSGTTITDYRYVTAAEADVVFPINRPHDPFPEGWTVTGTAPDRHLVAPDGSLRSVEWVDSSAAAPRSGGSQTETHVLTTDPDTFLLPALDIDFGSSGVVFMSIVVTALVADGETWGSGMGQIAAFLPVSAGHWQAQRDSTPLVPGWTGLTSSWSVLNANVNDAMDTVGQYGALTTVIPQCIRIDAASARGIYTDGGAGAVYAGANHPTATMTVTLEFH